MSVQARTDFLWGEFVKIICSGENSDEDKVVVAKLIAKKEQMNGIYSYIDKARVCGINVSKHG